jgi:hypothetical protein
MWFYVQHILIPYEQADASAHGRPRGNLSDLYPRWLGARELLLHHRDPYSPQVTREIQEGYYGRALDPGRSEDPKDQQGFAYPVYVVFLLAPTLPLRFELVQGAFRWFLVALTAATVLMWLRVLAWRPSGATTSILLVLTLGSFPALQGFKLEQLSLLVCGLVAGCAILLTSGYLVPAGIVLALAMIKPQLTLPFAGWLIVWAFAEWRTRRKLVWGFVATMAALFAGAEFLSPGWVGRFREAVSAYREYAGGAGSVLDVMITPTGGKILAAVIVLGIIRACWLARHQPAGSVSFVLVASLVLTATVVIIPTFAPYNQLLLLPGIFLLLRGREEIWQTGWPQRAGVLICILMVVWPWLAAASLTIASAVLPPGKIEGAWQVPLYTSLEIPVAVLALLVVYARRRLSGQIVPLTVG